MSVESDKLLVRSTSYLTDNSSPDIKHNNPNNIEKCIHNQILNMIFSKYVNIYVKQVFLYTICPDLNDDIVYMYIPY